MAASVVLAMVVGVGVFLGGNGMSGADQRPHVVLLGDVPGGDCNRPQPPPVLLPTPLPSREPTFQSELVFEVGHPAVSLAGTVPIVKLVPVSVSVPVPDVNSAANVSVGYGDGNG